MLGEKQVLFQRTSSLERAALTYRNEDAIFKRAERELCFIMENLSVSVGSLLAGSSREF